MHVTLSWDLKCVNKYSQFRLNSYYHEVHEGYEVKKFYVNLRVSHACHASKARRAGSCALWFKAQIVLLPVVKFYPDNRSELHVFFLPVVFQLEVCRI
jgi:hypothetical protein